MSEKTNNSIYDKLTPQRKQIVDEVLKNLESGTGLWKRGWAQSGAPESAISGKKYRGVNNFFLTLVAMARNYSDNRWVTFKQMEERDWHFKTDEEGNSLGKGASVTVEYFEYRDRQTKQRYDSSVLDGMDADERQEYMRDNVYPIRKYYRVFNGDIIDGIPEREKHTIDENGRNERAERLMSIWNEEEAKIIYGGSRAYYSPDKDEVHLPQRDDFYSMQEFYATAMHEIGHSTGHETRLNRDLSGGFGTPKYAEEELRAEIASMFLGQDFGIAVDENHIQNNSAYIKGWHSVIKDDPNVLFTAIADADKIAKFVTSKEMKKEIEPYAIIEDTDEYGDSIYKVQMIAEYGQTQYALSGYPFKSRDALMAEFQQMQKLPFWQDKEFREVSKDELQEMSVQRAEKKAIRDNVEEQPSEVYVKPSEIVTSTTVATTVAVVDMTGRGIESLTRMSDRDIVERASHTKSGDTFSQLYDGKSVLGSEEKDERGLFARLAMFTGNDQEQLLRIFRSSGQFRENKPPEYYEKMAQESIRFVESLKGKQSMPIPHIGSGKAHAGINAKT